MAHVGTASKSEAGFEPRLSGSVVQTLNRSPCCAHLNYLSPGPLYRRETEAQRKDRELVKELDHSQDPRPQPAPCPPHSRLHLSPSLSRMTEPAVQGGASGNKTDSTPGRRAACYEKPLPWDLTREWIEEGEKNPLCTRVCCGDPSLSSGVEGFTPLIPIVFLSFHPPSLNSPL